MSLMRQLQPCKLGEAKNYVVSQTEKRAALASPPPMEEGHRIERVRRTGAFPFPKSYSPARVRLEHVNQKSGEGKT
jgi:hypothetical protein